MSKASNPTEWRLHTPNSTLRTWSKVCGTDLGSSVCDWEDGGNAMWRRPILGLCERSNLQTRTMREKVSVDWKYKLFVLEKMWRWVYMRRTLSEQSMSTCATCWTTLWTCAVVAVRQGTTLFTWSVPLADSLGHPAAAKLSSMVREGKSVRGKWKQETMCETDGRWQEVRGRPMVGVCKRIELLPQQMSSVGGWGLFRKIFNVLSGDGVRGSTEKEEMRASHDRGEEMRTRSILDLRLGPAL